MQLSFIFLEYLVEYDSLPCIIIFTDNVVLCYSNSRRVYAMSGELGLRVVADLVRVIFHCMLENQLKMTQMRSKKTKIGCR